MQWINLELGMLPAIAIQTAKVIELYRNIFNDIEMGQGHLLPKLKQLNIQLKRRMHQLDQFYSQYYFDQRIHLFHRLKLQIKKMLTKQMEEIQKSYIQAQSLDLSKVREELALIESTLEKEYEKDKGDHHAMQSLQSPGKKSLTQSRQKQAAKKNVMQTSGSKIVPPSNKLNLEKLKASDSKLSTNRKSKPVPPPVSSSSKQKSTQRLNAPSIESTLRHLEEAQHKNSTKAPMQELVFTIKMTKQEYLEFLESKKNGS